MIIDVARDYGVVGNGVTDNAASLMKLRTDLAGLNKPHYVLHFPPGEVRYSNNRWLYGIQSFEIIGNGTTFRSIYSGSDDAFQRPLFVGELLQNNVLEYIGTKLYEKSSLFTGAVAGATQLQLVASGIFHAGDRVLIYAGNYADSGYPPPATAEWHEIESVTGLYIILKRPLKKNYPLGVWDNPIISGNGCGLPRVLNLDRPNNVYCKYAKFTGITFANATGGGMGNVIFPTERLEMVRCKGEGYFWPSENRIATFEDMDVNEVEFDKLVETVICNRVTFKNSPNGGGSIDKVIINDCQAGESMRFNPRYLEIRNTHIRGNAIPDQWIPSLADYPARNPIRRITLDTLTFSSGLASQTDHHINIAPYNSLQVISTVDKNIITTDFSVVKTMEPGTTVLFREDGSDGGLITSITHNGTAFVISGNWNYTPPANSTWVWCYVKEVVDLGGHRVLDNKRMWHGNSIRWKGNQSTGPIKEMCLTEKDFKWPGNILVDLYGYLQSIQFYPTKKYGHTSAMLNIETSTNQKLFETYLTTTFSITYDMIPWVKQLYLNTFSITGPTAPDILPKFDMIIKWRSF